jgi:CBS domain-containing protein
MRLNEVLRGKPDHVVILPPKATVTQASALMMTERVGAILVCEGKRILGILSERDLAVAIAARGSELFGLSIGELMSVDAPTATPGDAVIDVMRLMTEKRARHVPVVEGESVVGVISIGDVLKSRLAEKIQENAVLQDLARVRLPG